MSAHGRRRAQPGRAVQPGAQGRPAQAGPRQAGPAQLGWALVVIVAAQIGGQAADRIGHASIVIAVVVSLVVGALGVLWLFRSPGRPSELAAGYPEDGTTADELLQAADAAMYRTKSGGGRGFSNSGMSPLG